MDSCFSGENKGGIFRGSIPVHPVRDILKRRKNASINSSEENLEIRFVL